ncbi:short-chain dehydrogenase [Pedobacter psychrophilus]|uniref:Short-chain dehydrogenase n=1 Tax=Pedobacter psychrophilus TaxID=1826909 RepID=A0A179DFZ2_9SPHI|nr:SDR family oxidoreductase [Pedobacter psychrophilus]OAQ39804.1 short-chain dehydrogenase [Pedobacter psychrophilus]
MRLFGKTALITGGNSGIGFATAKLFLAQGAKVIITGRNQTLIDEAVAQLGQNAFGILCDAGNMQDINALPNKISKLSDTVDILFSNAGVGLFAPFEQTTEKIFDANMEINFKGTVFTIQKLLPLIPNGGSIVLNATVLAHLGYETSSAYSASKAAVLSFCKTLAIELAPKDIRVNTISPGPINTPIYSKMGIPQDILQEFAAGVQALIPMNRFGASEDIANAALFLASADSTFMTGSEIRVDGGKSITF